MSIPEARLNRNMPFLRRGMRADMDGRPGTITSGNSTRLRMRFDGYKYSSSVHPTWQMTFYGKDGSIVADYKKTGASKEVNEQELREALSTGEEIEFHLMGNERNTVPVPVPGWYSCIVEEIYWNGDVEISFTGVNLGVTVLKKNIGIAFRRKARSA